LGIAVDEKLDLTKLRGKTNKTRARDARAKLEVDALRPIFHQPHHTDCLAWNRFHACVVRFERPPSVLTVSGLFPVVNCEGQTPNKLGDEQGKYNFASFHILPASDDTASVVFIWKNDNAIGLAFAESYLKQRPELYSTLAIQNSNDIRML